MRYDTYRSMTLAVADEIWRRSHGLPSSEFWLMDDGSVMLLSPSWPLPENAVMPLRSAAPLPDWHSTEHGEGEITQSAAACLATVWMVKHGHAAINDAQRLAAMLSEQVAAYTQDKEDTCNL